MGQGRFITLEGGEGTGKSTLIAGLSDALKARSIPCMVTREPGGTPLAEAARSLVLHPGGDEEWSPLAQALIMNAARDDHLRRQIRPALENGTWVLCDRFADSTRAYQSIDGVAPEVLRAFERAVVGQTVPDLTLILDGDPKRLVSRRQERGTSDVFEKKALAFHDSIRRAFLQIAEQEPARCTVIDAQNAPDVVLARAVEALAERFEEI